MSCTSVSPEIVQKTCKMVAQIPHPSNRFHVDNRFIKLEYLPLPFLSEVQRWVKIQESGL